MSLIVMITLLSVICFALSQMKHFKTVFNKALSTPQSTLIRVSGLALILLAQYLLWRQPYVGLSYVIWVCWLSISIMMTGLTLSYLNKK